MKYIRKFNENSNIYYQDITDQELGSHKFYKCDQIDGLIKLLNDINFTQVREFNSLN